MVGNLYVIVAPIKLERLADFARYRRGRRKAREVASVALAAFVLSVLQKIGAVKGPPTNEADVVRGNLPDGGGGGG